MKAAAAVGLAALLLFATSLTEFMVRQTDLSALRVLAGDVPYRDFWTMYAPGSFVTLAGIFAVVGRELIVSTALGIVTSAAAVAVFFHLALTVVRPGAAGLMAGLVAVAFYSTGYHAGFTSYSPAILLILVALVLLASRSGSSGWRWTLTPGLLLGGAALFKHDIAGYAAVAAGMALLVTRHTGTRLPRWSCVMALAVSAAIVPLVAVGVLVALGAGPDMWRDLVAFPLGDFKYVRDEGFPLIPRLQSSLTLTGQELRYWAICNLPSVALVAGLIGLRHRWRSLSRPAMFTVTFSVVAFGLHWAAAHVQLNTNAISLAAWGVLVGGAGIGNLGADAPRARRLRWAASAVVAGWIASFLLLPAYRLATEPRADRWLGLPGLNGIRVSSAAADQWHGLAESIARAAPPEARLLFVGARNDVLVFASSAPFWLTPRRPATRYQELHPGITDTETVQAEMLAGLSDDLPPVVVREHRFDDRTLDDARAIFQQHVDVGSMLLDDWIAERYEPGPIFGRYEVMQRR